mmetsp:Transcript_5734/g.23812  ORF Transcript_5734/g.23812 Transcript_5734/m.23812 type:complete len:265 (+) Transcript_5734:2010-2804(+)
MSAMTSPIASIHSCMSTRSMAAIMSSSPPEATLNELRTNLPSPSVIGSHVVSWSSRKVFSPAPWLSVSRCNRLLPTSLKSLTCHVCLTRRLRVRLRSRPSLRVCTFSTMRRYSSTLRSSSLTFCEPSFSESFARPRVCSSSVCVSWSEVKWSVSDFSQSACIFSFSSSSTARCAELWFSSLRAASSDVLSCADRASAWRSRVVASASFFCSSKAWASLSDCSAARMLISTSSRFSSSTSRTALRWSSVVVVVDVDWCSSSCDFK